MYSISALSKSKNVQHLGKPVHYIQDGSGRDNYIRYNHGGLMSPSNMKSPTFATMIRKYERNQNVGFSRSPSIKSIEGLQRSMSQVESTDGFVSTKETNSFWRAPPATKFAKQYEALTGDPVLPYERPEPDIFLMA